MSYLFLGVCLLIGLVLLGRWFAVANPAQMVTAVKWALAVVGIGLALFFLVTGRLSWALAPLGLVLLFLGREVSRTLIQRLIFGGAGGVGGVGGGPRRRTGRGQSSEVETRYLRMVLDHDSAEMEGTVIEGAFAGRELGSLDFDELMRLLHECASNDVQSTRVLESYLDRREGADWRERAGARPGGTARAGPMSRDEAYEILGLAPGASDEEVREAHRRLMSKIHPDRGGSTYLAAQINAAKEVLLGH